MSVADQETLQPNLYDDPNSHVSSVSLERLDSIGLAESIDEQLAEEQSIDEQKPAPITTSWLKEMNSALKTHTPDVKEFDTIAIAYDRLEFGEKLAIDNKTFAVVGLDAAEEFGRNSQETSWLLTGETKADKEIAASFDAFTPKNAVLEFVGAQRVGQIEALHPDWSDAEIADEAGADARRALQLDAELRLRGWNESHIPGYDTQNEQAIELIAVPPTASEMHKAHAEARKAGRAFREENMVATMAVEEEYHHDEWSTAESEATQMPEDSETPTAEPDGPAGDEETHEQKVVRIGAEVQAKYRKPTVGETVKAAFSRKRVMALGHAALALIKPAPLIDKLHTQHIRMTEAIQTMSFLGESDPQVKWRKAVMYTGAFALGFTGIKASQYGYDMLSHVGHADTLANIPMPSGNGHVGAAADAHMNLSPELTPSAPKQAPEVIRTAAPARPSAVLEHYNAQTGAGTMEGAVIENLHKSGVDTSHLSHGQYQILVNRLDGATRALNHLSFEQSDHLDVNRHLGMLTPEEIQAELRRLLDK